MNIIPGKGGSGGGIATYSIQYIQHLNDYVDLKGKKIYCIKHPQLCQLDNCKNIHFINYNYPGNFLMRSLWIHIILPIFCIFKKIDILHRVTPEMPIIKVCKHVCTCHDLMFDFYLKKNSLTNFLKNSEILKFRIFRIITSLALNGSNQIIVPSETIKKELIGAYKIKESKIHAIFEASVKKQHHNKTLDIFKQNENIKFIVVAGFYPHKGHLNVIKLASLFIENGFNNFNIAFRGNPAYPDYIREIRNQVIKNNLENNISFIPFTKNINAEDIYNGYDIFLLLSEYEGFGLPVLEAQAFGLPVFCSDIPIFREVLQNSAYFINRDISSINLSELLTKIKNKDFLIDLKHQGEKNVEKFSWVRMSQQTFNLYNHEK